MGSFTSTGRVPRAEDADEDVAFVTTTREELLNRCEEELEDLPPPLERNFTKRFDPEIDATVIRIFQWNLLSQSKCTRIVKQKLLFIVLQLLVPRMISLYSVIQQLWTGARGGGELLRR